MASDGESVDSAHHSSGSHSYRGRARINDPFELQNGDNSSLVLVAEALNEFNYITWSRSMVIAFKSRGKLKFLTGEIQTPDLDDPLYDRWDKVNSTLISWILNSISKKIARGFMFFEDAYALWTELKERFGESNGPLIHKLKKDICELKQGTESVAVYFTDLKSLWDEYACLRPRKKCNIDCINYTCLAAEEEDDKLHQFLMGLNEEYSSISHQILLMDPLPSIGKAYSMITRIEKQKAVHYGYQEIQGNSAMAVKVYRDRRISYQNKESVND